MKLTMENKIISIRPFLGSVDFNQSSAFYRELGFEENVLWEGFSVFHKQGFSFYLQNAFVKEWLENTQLFIEVTRVDDYWNEIIGLNLPKKFPGVRVSAIAEQTWGTEFFVHDPAGILLHFGSFK